MQNLKKIAVWDLPTRLFHWSLAIAIVGLIITAKKGEMDWHLKLGYLVFALLIFRLIWGFVGGHFTRFSSFMPTPSRLKRYFSGQASAGELLGHAGPGAWSVLAMLLVIAAQLGTGLVADDDIFYRGPLTSKVSNAVVNQATSFHVNWGQYLVIGLVVLHVLAIVFYQWRGHRLLGSMWHGKKPYPELAHTSEAPVLADGWAQRLMALLVFAISCAVVYAVIQWGGS